MTVARTAIIVAMTATFACRASAPAAAPSGEASVSAPSTTDVDVSAVRLAQTLAGANRADVLLELAADGHATAGERYVALASQDQPGPTWLEVLGEADEDCAHCGRRYRTRVIPERGSLSTFWALGPLPANQRWRPTLVREHQLADTSLGDAWVEALAVDLTGAGQIDLVVERRCAGWLPSGCAGRVCGTVCERLVWQALDADGALACHAMLPDIEDCLP